MRWLVAAGVGMGIYFESCSSCVTDRGSDKLASRCHCPRILDRREGWERCASWRDLGET